MKSVAEEDYRKYYCVFFVLLCGVVVVIIPFLIVDSPEEGGKAISTKQPINDINNKNNSNKNKNGKMKGKSRKTPTLPVVIFHSEKCNKIYKEQRYTSYALASNLDGDSLLLCHDTSAGRPRELDLRNYWAGAKQFERIFVPLPPSWRPNEERLMMQRYFALLELAKERQWYDVMLTDADVVLLSFECV